MKERILAILDTIELSQVGWEDREDIMTFNGEPIGATIYNAEIDRWWPSLKIQLAGYIADNLAVEGRAASEGGEG